MRKATWHCSLILDLRSIPKTSKPSSSAKGLQGFSPVKSRPTSFTWSAPIFPRKTKTGSSPVWSLAWAAQRKQDLTNQATSSCESFSSRTTTSTSALSTSKTKSRRLTWKMPSRHPLERTSSSLRPKTYLLPMPTHSSRPLKSDTESRNVPPLTWKQAWSSPSTSARWSPSPISDPPWRQAPFRRSSSTQVTPASCCSARISPKHNATHWLPA